MFGQAIFAFRSNINALRDFVDVIEPVLQEKTQSVLQQRAEILAPLLLAFKKLEWPSEANSPKVDDEKLKQLCDELKITVTVVEGPDKGRSVDISGEDISQFSEAMQSLVKTLRHTNLLYESSLISLSSMAESFLASLLHRYFETYPEAVGIREKVFSLQDLRQLGSIEDARKSLVDSTVENILRGSFEDWLKFLREQAKLSMGYLAMDPLIEIFQRRNLLVHNAGVVNSIYTSRVAASFREQWKIGEHITVPRDYLDNAIALVELNFLLIAAELWKKLEPNSEERSELLLEISLDHLLAERWEVAEGLSFFVKNDKQTLERLQLMGQVNYWQTFKWRNRFEEVRSEVEKADFSAKEPLFQLALAALQDDLDKFFELLPEVLDSKRLSLDHLDRWPIFRGIRPTERYGLFMMQRKALSANQAAGQSGGENVA
jgi:hypothetical protein